VKRFTETIKWVDPWFRELSPIQKCVFLYCCDNCDNAGFIEVDFSGWAFHIGCKAKEIEAAWQGLARGFVGASGWVYIRTFLKHQKHLPLCPDTNPAERQIKALFEQQSARFPGLLEATLKGAIPEAPSVGLPSPIGIGQGKKPADVLPSDFGLFWDAYPRKVKRLDAVRAWLNAKHLPPIAGLLAAVETAKASEDWRKDGGKFIPYPASYINGERWTDKPPEMLAPLTATPSAGRPLTVTELKTKLDLLTQERDQLARDATHQPPPKPGEITPLARNRAAIDAVKAQIKAHG
jgi:hypothetical protein